MSPRSRTVIAAVGVLIVAVAIAVPSEPASGGGRTLAAWWTSVAGAALLLAAAVGVSARVAALGAVLVLGSAAQLALTKPTWLQYIRMRPHELAAETMPLAVALLAVQAFFVVRCGFRERRRWSNGWRAIIERRHWPFLATVFVFAAAHATLVYPHRGESKYLAFWALQLVAAAALFVLDLSNLLLIGDALPDRLLARGKELVRNRICVPGDDGPPRAWDRIVLPVCAVTVTVVCLVLSAGVLERVPHVPDGVAYLIQARDMAAGELSRAAPVEPDAFRVYLVDHRDDRLFAVTNPGWPAVLSVGVAIGAPWIVNPILAGLCVLLFHRLVRLCGNRGRANAMTLLLACSPWFLWLGASFMTHTATLAFALAGAVVLAGVRGRPLDFALAFAGGCAMGMVFLIRPLDGLLAGSAAALAFAVRGAGSRPRRALVLGIWGLGCVAVGSLLLRFNHLLTGDFLETPINRYLAELWYPGTNALGFGPRIGNTPEPWGPLDPIPGHGWRDVLLNTNQNLYNLNFELLGWCVGSLSLIVIRFLRPGWSAPDRWMAWSLVVFCAAYALYWFSGGPDFGPRYWFLMIGPCLWLTLSGARELAVVLAERTFVEDSASRLTVMIGILVLISLTVFMPWRAVAKYSGYRGFHSGYRALAADGSLDDAIVFVETPEDVDFGCALILNEPGFPGGAPVFARDLGASSRAAIAAAFPDRRVVRVRGRAAGGVAIRD